MENSKIEWTDHTFNPWIGCTKVSQGCANCYAENLMDKRWGKVQWGPQGQRVRTSAAKWREPLKWNKQAQKEGRQYRVFCASLADVFEDNPQLVEARHQLFALIDRTPNLDWLLLTKRPENIQRLWPFGWYDDQFTWQNVWIGTSVEDQAAADKRIPELLKVPAKVRFLSCEPLLGPVSLDQWFGLEDGNEWQDCMCDEIDPSDKPCIVCESRQELGQSSGINWVIVGGESGHHARPMHPKWAQNLRNECLAAGVPFFFKQWGEWIPAYHEDWHNAGTPVNVGDTSMNMIHAGKKAAGRILGGREWNQTP